MIMKNTNRSANWSKILLTLIIVMIYQLSKAQGFDESNYSLPLKNLNQLPLDSLWKFHPGDNPVWADSVIDEQDWKIVNTEYLQDEFKKPVRWSGIGWFRKQFRIPKQFQGQALSIMVAHYGASEIYLDGKLFYSFGKVGRTIEQETIFVPRHAVIIQPDTRPMHLLVVRYSNQHAATPGYFAKFTGFRILVNSPNNALTSTDRDGRELVPIIFSIVFAFGLFFLLVYFFYPTRLASFLTALTLFNFSCIFIGIYMLNVNSDWRSIKWGVSLKNAATWHPCFTLLVLYALYYSGKLPRRTWVLAAFTMLFIFFDLVPSSFSWNAGPLSLLIILETIRMFYLGLKNRKTGFLILVIGWIISWLGILFFIIDIFNWFNTKSSLTLGILRTIFSALSVPLTYALQLAWEFGTANRNLQRQLVQVNELSETTRRQDKEKQQILSQQNEILEKGVQERTADLEHQKLELQNTLTELKSAQSQLVQKEKMASLGELTAGIAHEIQNPLNFVNNFSEVNKELIAEMRTEIEKGNLEEVKFIAEDIEANSEKINHHGKRADSIVKGMLQHSRVSRGHKEQTNINALADEYLRLSYHGLRAKDKNFNADFKTDFDESIGNINIIPQDIGRVLLNIINNAFYAVNEKKKQQPEGYEPTVLLSTKKTDNTVLISVKDNGDGIPQKVVDKIFQPFFTTKPTGEGTGLGLSLSYDIIKAHGGEIKVETKEGEGSEFIIQLPIT